ncbi:receptor-type tyrosine-protein phosphatase H-like isoform X6 [Channa argus]|uniref:receptor-type tyrosine-protein phosphatase H-like isoform X6 n=1 Tax=Channa argus TaxID=215402 RepID=UPI003520808B
MVKPLSVKITSNHLLLCIFLCLLWGVTDINTSTTTVTNTKVSSTTISTAISPPPNVNEFRSVGQNETSITLQWKKVNGILDYVLQYGNISGANVRGEANNDNVTYTASHLNSGTQYNFTLFTVFENVSSTGVHLISVTAPTNAENFRSVGQNETSITLQWKKVDDILDYVLQYGNISGANVRGEANNDNVTYTASHLNSGTQYNFTLFTVFKNVRSTGVNLSAVTAPPNAEEFKSVGQNETSVTLQWIKGNGIYNYTLKFNNTEKNVEDENVTFIASHLKSGTEYYFTLFTVFKNVRSTGVNLSAVTAPTNAENFRSVGQNETSITLQWKKVNGILDYVLQYGNISGANVRGEANNDNVTYTASHLNSGTQYNFTLFTVFENVSSTGVHLISVTAPPNAEEFKSVGQNETSVTLQWIKGDGIYNYTLKFNDKETVVTGNEDNNVMFIASDLKSGTEYGFTLFTVFKNVRSTGVNLSAVTAPANAENSGENFRSVGQNETSITLQWKKVNGILDYVLQYGNISGANVRGEANNDNVTYTASHLNSGTQYNFTLFTVFENVSSTGVHLISVTAPPNAEEFKSVGQNETSVTLQWIKGNGIYNYTLKFNNTEKNVEDENVTFIASHLKSGTEYYFTLFTVFKNVRSTGVNLSAVTAPTNAENFRSVGQNETSITLQWKKVNGILDYVLQYGNISGANVRGEANNDNVTYTASHLNSGTQYNFTLFTVFENVSSTGVHLISVTAPANAENSGENFRSVGQNETSITLQWKKVNGILDYVLQYGNISGANVRGEANNDNVTYTASHLNSGTQYNFTLFTVFENVSSTGVHLISVTAPPNAEEFKSVGQNETSVTLQWIKGDGIYNYTLKFNDKETVVTGNEDNNVMFIASDLKSGTEYGFTLFTVFKNVRSSGVNLSAVTAPTNAENFRSVGQNETSITLQWKKVNGILDYVLQYGNISGANVRGEANNDNVTYTASHLNSGTQYNFTLFTVFKNVSSTGVHLISVTAPTNAENFRSVGQNETSITLRWKKVNGIFNYIIKFNNIEKNVTGNENNNVTFIASDLKSGTQYHFTLFTVFKNVRSTGVNLSAVTAPSNTDAFKSIGQNETSITLQWKKVEGISKYTLAFNKTRINVNAEKEQVTHTILELKSGTKYNFTLFTEFKNVSSSGQNLTAVTAPENVKNVQVLGQNESSITLTWGKVNNISTYILQYVNNNDTILGQSSPFDQGTLVTYAVTLLTPGRKYNFIVITVFEEVSSTGYRFNAATVPPRVPLVNVSERSVTKITLQWNNTNTNWSYLLRINGMDVIKNVSSSVVSHSVASLKPGTAYNFSVITMFDGLNSTAYKDSTVTAIDCSSVNWYVTNSSIQGIVEGLFSKATASNATKTNVSPGGSNVTFTDLYPGETYEISLEFEKYQQCHHNLTIRPPSLRAHCEYEASGYSIKIILDETDGVWTAVEINVIGKTLVYNKNQNYKISGFQPAKNYEVSLTSLSGNVSSSTAFVFECSTDPRAVIAGSVLAVLFFLLICLVVFILFMRPELIRKKAFICGSILSVKKNKAISVTKFEDHFFHLSMDDNRGFSLEYESLAPVGTEQTRRAAVLPENKPKNRFNNVLPYDWSRVRLTTHLSGTSDYINANYMPGFNSNREYIATQGPLPSTVNDFWRMIWEQRVMGIVMVTNCTEGGRTKCEQYWPANRNPCLYDKLEVTMIYEQQEPNWTLREFNVKHRNSSESRTVKHFHFTAWPDHGVPQSTEVLIQFRALVRQHIERQGNGAPTVVHCSAGVGRTGTIIALDVFLQEMDKKGEIGINAFVHKMRLSRPHMVQTESQYIFLHQCIVDSLHPCENNEENIYENTEGIYVNATALREFRNTTND